MMKLYYSAGSCSTSCHITLEESGLKYEAAGVDWDNEHDPLITVINKLNPLGTLPILITEEGKQLDQNLAIHTYIADKAPDKKLLPPFGTPERAEAMNWLAFVQSDLHKGIGDMFGIRMVSNDKNVQTAVRDWMLKRANKYLGYMDAKLNGKDYLTGKLFTPADAYAYVVTGWTQWLEIPLTPYKNISNYLKRIEERPAVARVLKAEGLT